ncbi:hypothetical protein TNCV_4528881 [Trichonephila clavipes]|nr:hypothetical protein TNCV_4528881 [Trichonephila clavipes]
MEVSGSAFIPPTPLSRQDEAQRYQVNDSHCEAMAVLTCPKPIPKVNLVSRPEHNTAFVRFTGENNQGERNTSKEILRSVRVEEWYKISTDEK